MDNTEGSEEGEVMTGKRGEKRQKEEGVSEKQVRADDASTVVKTWFVL